MSGPASPATLTAPPAAVVSDDVRRALAEDLGDGDVTASLVAPDLHGIADVICRDAAVLAGVPWFTEVFRQVDAGVSVEWLRNDGAALVPGDLVCTLTGPAAAIVSGERTALNFLQTLSGTATVTQRYVAALGDGSTRILDTRKTIPGLRVAQKYAVRCGGGSNHRMGLYDAVLIKENHIAAAGSVGDAVRAIRARHPELSIEVEVESLEQLREALAAGTDMVLLDNFSAADITAAKDLVGSAASIEISGGVEFDQLAQLGRAGADFISVGALTKHVRAVDFSMRMREQSTAPA